jgi:hypothetical protein
MTRDRIDAGVCGGPGAGAEMFAEMFAEDPEMQMNALFSNADAWGQARDRNIILAAVAAVGLYKLNSVDPSIVA